MLARYQDLEITLNKPEQQQVLGLLGKGATKEDVLQAASDSLAKVAKYAAGRVDAAHPPVLQDADVFVAQKLLDEPGMAVNRDALKAMLDAWNRAESELKTEARVAMRQLEQVLKRVFAAANREEFCKWFSRGLGQRINRNHAMYLRQFLQLLKEWSALGEPVMSPEPHYVEYCMAVSDLHRFCI